MEIVRSEHVARLLHARESDPVLVVYRGRAEVVPEAALEEARYKGALRLAGRGDLGLDRDGDPSDEEIGAVARRLNSAVAHLGG